ncbi:MAG: sulfate reduction electron transfer complex DsrMKJOP subunit DsrJ [Deltaproteobacteria bacterium]|nr:sulfate reduction electron transfer complex DsrMKJOP subunit DsrJ [Deltaproteobacteria bacterium]
MRDTAKVIIGILVFLVLVTTPFWYGKIAAESGKPPVLKVGTAEKECVMSKDFMRANHMDLLNEWRDHVVREADRVYVREDGRRFDKSLGNTCMKCHTDKKEFCDKCHSYSGVKEPFCWDCHNDPNAR